MNMQTSRCLNFEKTIIMDDHDRFRSCKFVKFDDEHAHSKGETIGFQFEIKSSYISIPQTHADDPKGWQD